MKTSTGLRYAAFSKISSLLLFSFASVSTFALTPQVEQFVKWETEANAVAARSSQPFAVKHFEIPLVAVESSFAKYLDPQVKDALVFKKNGVDYVRWIINPEDTKWHVELADVLKAGGLDATQYDYFTGYQTASRSMIFEDPKSHAQFSIKVSTDHTGGMWKDKKQHLDDGNQVRMMSDFIFETEEKVNFDRVILQKDPLLFGAPAVDQALIVRSLADLPKGDHYYLPGFSAVHETVGKDIALLNGSKDPAKFWNENYNKPLAEAIAEMAAHFGITYDSPHSQNFLVELDKNMKPTGKIVLRDFGDMYVQTDLLRALNRPEFIAKWEQGNLHTGKLDVAVGIMHGNTPPSWLSDSEYRGWGVDFFKAFEAKFSSLTGVPVEELAGEQMAEQGSFSYFSKNYRTKTVAWNKYLEMAQCFAGSSVTKAGIPCPENLLKRLKSNIIRAVDPRIAAGVRRADADAALRVAQHTMGTAAPQKAPATGCAHEIASFFGMLRAFGR